jgi:hypothetical protein
MKWPIEIASWWLSMRVLTVGAITLLAPHVSAETKVGTTALAIPPGRGLEPFGVWSGDALVTVEGFSSPAPVIQIYDRSGSKIQRIVVQVPESQWTILTNGGFTRSQDGWVALAGVAHGKDNKAATFLAVISPDASKQVLVRTDSYVPSAVVFSSDGTIWTAGKTLDATDYPIIRRFDKSGTLLGTALWRSRFPRPDIFGGESYLVASGDRVGWFSPGARAYVEFSPDGTEIASYKHTLAQAEGVALCDDNSVWVSEELTDNTGQAQYMLNVLDRVHGSWSRGAPRSSIRIYGCSGTTLATTSSTDIDWIKPR